MAVDLEALVAPLDGEDPAGPDLSYDNDRTVIEAAFAGGEDGEAVAWRDIVGLIEEQCARTRDLQLGVMWMRAGAMMGRLGTIADAARYTAALAEANWEHMHPKLDEYGFQGRKGACESLTRIGDFLGPLRRTILIEHPRLGSYSGTDLERFAAEGDTAEGYGMFRAAMAEMPPEEIDAAIGSLDTVRDSVRQLETVLDANAGDDTGTNFETTYDALRTIRSALAQFGGTAEPEPEAGGDAAPLPGGGGGGGGPRLGAVDSREDVTRALDAICDYYRRREPGSPVPVLLGRARGLVDLDFMELLEDLLPDAVSDAERILKSRKSGAEDSSW